MRTAHLDAQTMTKTKQEEKDEAALAELKAWCKPLSIDVRDDGYSLSLWFLNDKRINFGELSEAQYASWLSGKRKRSKAAAAREMLRAITSGAELYATFRRSTKAADGATIDDKRTYSFCIPKSSSPEELALKLDLAGWKPPNDVWSM